MSQVSTQRSAHRAQLSVKPKSRQSSFFWADCEIQRTNTFIFSALRSETRLFSSKPSQKKIGEARKEHLRRSFELREARHARL